MKTLTFAYYLPDVDLDSGKMLSNGVRIFQANNGCLYIYPCGTVRWVSNSWYGESYSRKYPKY
jgi:hypothetical protein